MCLKVFDLFTVPSYNGYMAAAYKNYTIDWTPKVDATRRRTVFSLALI